MNILRSVRFFCSNVHFSSQCHAWCFMASGNPNNEKGMGKVRFATRDGMTDGIIKTKLGLA